jgi:hypothetical protein
LNYEVDLVQVLAVLHEITWLETHYHEGIQVNGGWLSRLIVWSLNRTARHNRQQLLAATAEQQTAQNNHEERDVEEDMVSVYIGAHTMQPTAEISSNAISLAAEGSSTDVLASPVLVSMAECSASPRQLVGIDPRTDGNCTALEGV